VFSVRYELSFYILFRRNSVFKGLIRKPVLQESGILTGTLQRSLARFCDYGDISLRFITKENIVTRLVTVDGYWIDNWIYCNRTLKYNTTESLRTPSGLQLTIHSLTQLTR
jgi:hypothetical protein